MARHSTVVSRRAFAKASASALAGFGVSDHLLAEQRQSANQPTTAPQPESLRSEFLMDLILETGGSGSGSVGRHSIVAVNSGTFEGPRLRGKVLPPGADWPLSVTENLRVLDVRTVLMTDDDQRIYCTYRGVIFTPPTGQGERYWRTTPVFETASEKYSWLNHIVAVGVNFTVPQRVAYRIFQIL